MLQAAETLFTEEQSAYLVKVIKRTQLALRETKQEITSRQLQAFSTLPGYGPGIAMRLVMPTRYDPLPHVAIRTILNPTDEKCWAAFYYVQEGEPDPAGKKRASRSFVMGDAGFDKDSGGLQHIVQSVLDYLRFNLLPSHARVILPK